MTSENLRFERVTLLLCAAVLLAGPGFAGVGDLLLCICRPGSYSRTGNVTGPIGKRGVEIAASGVVAFFDIDPFLACLFGGSPACP